MPTYKPLDFVLKDSLIKNSENHDLTHPELIQFWNFIHLIKKSSYSTIIFRGESDENLRSQYNCDSSVPDILSQKIFMLGEKGRQCWHDKVYFDPDKTSTDNFILILNRLKEDINDGCKGNSFRSKKMREFIDRNPEFKLSLNSTDDVIVKYEHLAEKDKKHLNIYYLSLAHTINSFKYKKASNFVSVTTSSKVGEKFSDSITLYGWVPKNHYSNSFKVNNRRQTLVSHKNGSWLKIK